MALKPQRAYDYTDDITHNCTTAAERGNVLVYNATSGSGVAIGDSAGDVSLVSNPSGYVVAGMLLNDVVSVNTAQYHTNFHKDQTLVNNRCTLWTRGWVVTNRISGTPAVGNTAYLTTSGALTPTVSATGGTTATPKFGRFESIKDENSYVKVSFSLPVI